MSRFFVFALSVFLIDVVHCAANPFLRPRQDETCTGNVTAVSCPPEDLAFYPLAESLSGPYFDLHPFLRCYYPFVSNCQYNIVSLFSSRLDHTYKSSFWQTTGARVRDMNEDHCPLKISCGGDCASEEWCPSTDNAGYSLGPASVHVPEGILFCSYPTAIQPYIAVYFCNYVSVCVDFDLQIVVEMLTVPLKSPIPPSPTVLGAFIYGENPVASGALCPTTALIEPFCATHSASSVLVGEPTAISVPPSSSRPRTTTLAPVSGTRTNAAASAAASATPSPRFPGGAPPISSSVDLRLRIAGTVIMTLMPWVVMSLL